MEEWKGKRFVIAEFELGFGYLVVLTDIAYWNEHYEQLQDWCHINNAGKVEGMTVSFQSREELLLFTLRWS